MIIYSLYFEEISSFVLILQVEEWLLKSQSAEGPKSVSDYNSFREQQEVEKRQKVIKWPSIYTTDNIDKYHSQLETIEFRGQGHSFVQDVNEAESFENWKQTVARKKEVAKQQQVVEQTRFAKAYGRRNNSTIISEKQNQEKKEKVRSNGSHAYMGGTTPPIYSHKILYKLALIKNFFCCS